MIAPLITVFNKLESLSNFSTASSPPISLTDSLNSSYLSYAVVINPITPFHRNLPTSMIPVVIDNIMFPMPSSTSKLFKSKLSKNPPAKNKRKFLREFNIPILGSELKKGVFFFFCLFSSISFSLSFLLSSLILFIL